MSEPITRADLLVLFQYLKDGAFSRELTLLGMVVCNYLEPHDRPKAESASPPRVPGPSAQFAKVGVQSGPGQPIDICERLDNLAQQGHRIGYPTCDDIAEAAAEIRRLRAEIAAMDSLLTRTFDDLGVLREQVKTERRAGVEAAAQYCIEGDVLLPGQAKAMVRALADKPAPDLLRPGLEYIAKKIDEHRYAFRSEVSAAEAHKAAGIEYSTLVHREIAARKGG